jgi:hypothetical protein
MLMSRGESERLRHRKSFVPKKNEYQQGFLQQLVATSLMIMYEIMYSKKQLQ